MTEPERKDGSPATLDLAAREAKLAAIQRAASKHTGIWTEEEKRALAARRQIATPDASGQSAEIFVENFNGAPETEAEAQMWLDAGIEPPAPMHSYLRIGAVPEDLKQRLAAYVDAAKAVERAKAEKAEKAEKATQATSASANAVLPSAEPPGPAHPSLEAFEPWTGEDLALRVLSFGDDKLRRCFEGLPVENPGPEPRYAFAYRIPSAREAESDELHTRGGWREHTDGNRVTTTRGDKVEVIGGNARLIVLGRDPLGFSESGWEGGGGHMSGRTHMRGATSLNMQKSGRSGGDPLGKISVLWEDRAHGVWTSTEAAIKGDGRHIQHGDSDERAFGHVVRLQTGDENPVAWHTPETCTFAPDTCRANPKIENRTWATSIDVHVGSKALPVPRLESVTHVEEMRTEMHADRLTTTTHAETMSATTRCAHLSDSTVADSISTTTLVDTTMSDVAIVGEHVMETVGVTTDVTMANTLSFTSGSTANLTAGGSASLLVGAKVDLSIGARISATTGATLDVTIGAKATTTAGFELNMSLLSRTAATAATDAEMGTLKRIVALVAMIG